MPNAVALVPEKSTRVVELDDVVDGWPAEQFDLGTDTGDSPLENGASVTDHAVARPESVTLTGRVDGLERSSAAWDQLHAMYRNLDLVTLASPVGSLDELIIERCSNRRIGDGMEIRLTLKRILRVGLDGREGVTDPTPDGPAASRTATRERGRVAVDETVENPLGPVTFVGGDGVVDVDALRRMLDASVVDAGDGQGGGPGTGFAGRLNHALANLGGDPSRLVRNAANLNRAWRRDGARGLVGAMNSNVLLPAGVSNGTTDAALAVVLSRDGSNGLALARALDSAGAAGLRREVELAQAANVLARSFD